MRSAEPVPAIIIMSTVTRAIGIVLFEPLVDVEVDFFYDLPVASSSAVVLVAPLCRIVHGRAARHLSFLRQPLSCQPG